MKWLEKSCMWMSLKVRQKYLTTLTCYFSNESDIKTIDSVTPDELLVNLASLEPLYGTKYSKVDHVKFVEASLQKNLLGPLLNTWIHMLTLILNLCGKNIKPEATPPEVFLKISQNSQENTWARVPFLIKLTFLKK